MGQSAWLLTEQQIRRIGKELSVGQEPYAYYHNEIIDGSFSGYVALYDSRESKER